MWDYRRLFTAVVVVAAALNGGAGAASAAPSEWNEADTPAILTLYSVSCSSATFCVAVGGGADRFTRQIQIAMYDGTTWSRVRKPLGRGTILASVSCVSETFCMAVGVHAGASSTTRIYKWDGIEWVASPQPEPRQDLQPARLRIVSERQQLPGRRLLVQGCASTHVGRDLGRLGLDDHAEPECTAVRQPAHGRVVPEPDGVCGRGRAHQ